MKHLSVHQTHSASFFQVHSRCSIDAGQINECMSCFGKSDFAWTWSLPENIGKHKTGSNIKEIAENGTKICKVCIKFRN